MAEVACGVQNLLMTNPPGAVALAKAIIKQPGPPMDKTTIANEFIQRQLYAEATSFALDALAEDKAEEGAMQVPLSILRPDNFTQQITLRVR